MMNADLIPTIFVLSLLFCLSTSSPLTFDPLKALSSTGSIPSIFLNQDLISLRAAVSLCQYGKCSWDVIEGESEKAERFMLAFMLPQPQLGFTRSTSRSASHRSVLIVPN